MRNLTSKGLEYLKNPLYRNSLILLANTFITSLLGFFFWILVARIYDDYDVGLASAATSALTMIGIIGLAGFNNTLIRFLSKSPKPADLINSSLTLCGIISLAAGIIFVMGLNIWSPVMIFIKENAIFAIAFIFFGVITAASLVMESVFVSSRRSQFVLIKNLIYSVVKLILPVVLVLFFRSFGIVSSWGLATVVAFIVSGWWLVPRLYRRYYPRPMINLELLRGIWRYSLSNYIATILSLLPSWLLPLIVVNVLGPTENAYFYVAWMINNLLSEISISASKSLFAESSFVEANMWIDFRKSIRFTYTLLVPATVVILLLSSFLLSLFGSNYSAGAADLLRLLAVSTIFSGLIFLYLVILRVKSHLTEMNLLYGLMAVASLVGSYLALKNLGLIGIGYVQIGISVVVFLYIVFRLRTVFSKRA